MVSPELSSAVLVADVALYGFIIAYYALSLNLREQERSHIVAVRGPSVTGCPPSAESADVLRKADERWINVLASEASGSLFLMGCTLFAVPSAVLGVLAMSGLDALGLWAVILFVVFLVVVAVGIVGVAVQNFRANVREAREKLGADTPVMDILNRGLGKQ